MSPRIITLNKTQVVVGLEWDLLDGESERKAIREVIKNNPKVKAGVVVRSADCSVLGFMEPGQKKPSAPSGAALIALANQDSLARASGQSSSIEDDKWIVIEEIQEDEFWVVDIKDGLPIPGSDFIGSFERVRAYLDEMLNSSGFKVFTKNQEIQDIADNKASVIKKSAAEIIDDVEKQSRASLKTVSGLDPKILVVAGGFVLLLGGFFAWDQYRKMSLEKQQQLAAQARAGENAAKLAAEKKGYEDALRAAVLSALDTGIESVNSGLKTVAPSESLVAMVEIVEGLPLSHSGWWLSSAECVMKTPEQPACVVTLSRGELGINRILAEDYPQAVISGDSATYEVLGPTLSLREPDWSFLPMARSMSNGLVSDLQFAKLSGISFTQEESKDIVQPIVLPEKPVTLNIPGQEGPVVQPPPVNTSVGKGGMALTGSYLWQISGLAKIIDQSGLSVTGLNVSLGSASSHPWRIQSEYMVRTNTSPTIPTVLGPDGPLVIPLPEKYKSLVTAEEVDGAMPAAEGIAENSEAEEKVDESQDSLTISMPEESTTP